MGEKRREYDSAYKYLFSNKRIFHEFLTRFVHEDFVGEISLKDIEKVDKSFVSDEFLKRESDIIYKVKTLKEDVYIYILVEFQSTVDKTIPVRMLLYILQMYDELYRNSRKGKLPAIFPVLLYNGNEKWTVPVDISELIEGTIPLKYIPAFRYYPVIENEISDGVLRRIKGIMAAIIYLEKQKDEKLLSEAIDTVIELIKEERPQQLKMFTVWLNKMFRHAIDNKEVKKITGLTEVKSMITQIAEQIEARGEKRGMEQGMEQGMERGMEQGMEKKAREDALRMKEKGYALKDIADITGLTEEEIKKL